ncbi:MAG: hypothetical protein RML94_13670 [Bacteroidia bacterium]|nr:hypothetical protein [Bacteroidia bacterium]
MGFLVLLFGRVPRLRFGSACYGLRLRFGASLRYALLTHPPHASRK